MRVNEEENEMTLQKENKEYTNGEVDKPKMLHSARKKAKIRLERNHRPQLYRSRNRRRRRMTIQLMSISQSPKNLDIPR